MVASRYVLCGELLSAVLTQHGFDVDTVSAFGEWNPSVDPASADILVIDTEGNDALDVSRLISATRDTAPELPVLAVVDTEDDGMLFSAFDAGATAIVHRDQPLAQLVYAIRSAADRQSVLAPTLADKVLARLRSTSSQVTRERSRLSMREVSVLGGVARGMTNEQIARETGVSPSTVKNQLYSACRKLGVSSRSHAIAEAIRRGIIAPTGDSILAR